MSKRGSVQEDSEDEFKTHNISLVQTTKQMKDPGWAQLHHEQVR